jgi:hypothetical protein
VESAGMTCEGIEERYKKETWRFLEGKRRRQSSEYFILETYFRL